MTLTITQLGLAMFPHAPSLVDASFVARYCDPVNAALATYNIATPLRIAHFLAQVGHESGSLRLCEENLNYSAAGLLATWPNLFDAATAAAYAHQPEKIANRAYANRMSNGSEASGDGWRFKGRGLIQMTGRANYTLYSASTKRDVVTDPNPALVASDAHLAVDVAGWYWSQHGLNQLADLDDCRTITRRINGGLNGLDDRLARLARAKSILLNAPLPEAA